MAMDDDEIINIDGGVVFTFEQEKRRRFIRNASLENDTAKAAVLAEREREIIERAFTRPVEDTLTRDRAWIAEREAELAREREQEAASAPAATPQAPDWD
jgi:hypothetical protein